MQYYKNLPIGQFIVLVSLSIILISGCSRSKLVYPVTERKPVTDDYYGTKVVDEYRWLDNLSDLAVRQWNNEQNAFSRKHFDNIPALPLIRERLKQLYSIQSVDYSSLVMCKKLFALKFQPSKDQPFIVVFDSPENLQSEKVVVDPNELNPKGTTAIDWFVPSLDGSMIAVSLSENGSENGSVHVFEVATGKEIAEVIPRVQYPTGGGSLAWNKDGTGFFYTRYPHGNERPAEDMNFYQQVYYHKLGTPVSKDAYVIGKEFPRIAEVALFSSKDGRYILAQVANGDGGEFAHFLMKPGGKWVQITQFTDKVTTGVFGKEMLYLLSHQNAPKGKILALPLASPRFQEAKVIVPESDVSISNVAAGEKNICIVDMNGGPSQIRIVNIADKTVKPVPIQSISSVNEVVLLDHDELLFLIETYLTPHLWYR